MPEITSRQHPIVRAFRAAARGDGDLALLDGWHLLRDAVDAGLALETVAVRGDAPAEHRGLLERAAIGADIVSVSPAVMDALSPVRTPAGVVALARPMRRRLQELLTPAPALIVVAIDVQDPGNAGAIVRSAEAGGATGVVLSGVSAQPWGWKALRAAMGSTFRLPVVHDPDARGVCARVRREGLRIYAAVPRSGVSLHRADLSRACAILLGGEGPGLSDELAAAADERLSIPMHGPVDSLNVAVAAALLVYEARRQRDA